MSVAKWIWYPGDFEIWHHAQLSTRRQEKGCDYPCQWHLNRPEVSVRFRAAFTADADTVIRVVTKSSGMARLVGKLWPVNTDVPVPAGRHEISVELFDHSRFPSCFIDSPCLVTDERWQADAFDAVLKPAACEPAFYQPEDDPAVFPFSYRDLTPVSREAVNGGVLWDYGRENFGPVAFSGLTAHPLTVVYGESRAEALDPSDAIIRETLTEADCPVRPARAFRYLWLSGADAERVSPEAKLEYLPIEDKASFSCDAPLSKEIWDLASWTFHLNTREFFLDGIKRDRWVWSGDAYQSYMIARYLYNDPSVTERTITALYGRQPVRSHVNTINDYSAFLIMGTAEHYEATGRRGFLARVWPEAKALYAFILGRLDERGYAVKRGGDWIFIDWGVLDKDGAHCFEQILLWRTHLAMATLARAMEEDDAVYLARASALETRIRADFRDEEKGAFIDTPESGKRFVTRQTNVAAVLFGFANADETAKIVQNVFKNPDLPAITTPYFKLYELMALCKVGRVEQAQDYVSAYWDGMLGEGATSVWEAYDPTESGDEHFAMYGSRYGKSLCHAWGSGPILLWCRYIAGVEITSPAAKTFTVTPQPGRYRHFAAVVPVGKGQVEVAYDAPFCKVKAAVPGGVFVHGETRAALEPGKTYTFRLDK